MADRRAFMARVVIPAALPWIITEAERLRAAGYRGNATMRAYENYMAAHWADHLAEAEARSERLRQAWLDEITERRNAA